MMMLLIGAAMLAIGGGLLHDVPFPRFVGAYTMIVLGSKLFDVGYGAL